MGKVRTADRTREEVHANWLREEAVRRERREAEARAEAVRILRDRSEPRDRALAAVSALSGVSYRKVLRLLDGGLGTAETRRQVGAVLRERGREDLAPEKSAGA